MKHLLWLYSMQMIVQMNQPINLRRVRELYQSAPIFKQDAVRLDQMMLGVDPDHASPLYECYKGATKMIDAKYTINPITKYLDFKSGKNLINKGIMRDSLNLEMRFIRFSIQSNLPSYLGYHGDLPVDEHFLLTHTANNKDPQLKAMIVKYFTTQFPNNAKELKQLKN
jgi:hypothetical protein